MFRVILRSPYSNTFQNKFGVCLQFLVQEFFNDSLNFLSFNTNSKPWPFKDETEEPDSNEEVEVVEGKSEEVNLVNEPPEQTTP